MNQQSNPFIALDGKKPTCMQMLQSILDGDASSEQKDYFRHHMDKCMPCFKTYEVDMAIKDMLRIKCKGEEVPKELVDQLKDLVKHKMSS